MNYHICPYSGCRSSVIGRMCYLPCYKTMHYSCDICANVRQNVCMNHRWMILFICPYIIDRYNSTISSREIIELFTDKFRSSAIRGCIYYTHNTGVRLLLEDERHININFDDYMIETYNPIGPNIYCIEQMNKFSFIKKYEQYTYKPVLDSLKTNTVTYLNRLPRDITLIIRAYL